MRGFHIDILIKKHTYTLLRCPPCNLWLLQMAFCALFSLFVTVGQPPYRSPYVGGFHSKTLISFNNMPQPSNVDVRLFTSFTTTWHLVICEMCHPVSPLGALKMPKLPATSC